MSAPVTRRRTLAATAAAALGLAIGAAPALASSTVPPAVHPDAALIALADRVMALSRRCDAAANRRATLDDEVMKRCPRRAIPTPVTGRAAA